MPGPKGVLFCGDGSVGAIGDRRRGHAIVWQRHRGRGHRGREGWQKSELLEGAAESTVQGLLEVSDVEAALTIESDQEREVDLRGRRAGCAEGAEQRATGIEDLDLVTARRRAHNEPPTSPIDRRCLGLIAELALADAGRADREAGDPLASYFRIHPASQQALT